MSNWITEAGFNKKILSEIKTQLEDKFKQVFGNDIDISPDSVFGQLIGILSKREADLWDGASEIYTARIPSQASGINLDNIASENGIIRLSSTKTLVSGVNVTGDDETVVSAGKRAKRSGDEIEYILLESVEIKKEKARQIWIEAENPEENKTYKFTIDGNEVEYVALSTDGLADVLNELKDGIQGFITGGQISGTVTIEDELVRYQSTEDFNFNPLESVITEKVSSAGIFEAEDPGAYTLPANTLTQIVTPASGWVSVNNPLPGVTGTENETDEELRLRRNESLLAGFSTEEAIRQRLINEVEGVSQVTISSNRTGRGNIVSIEWSENFIADNIIKLVFRLGSTTEEVSINFDTDQNTTMLAIKSGIESEITGSSVNILEERRLSIKIEDQSFIEVEAEITGGASQATSSEYFSDEEGRPSHSFEAVVYGGIDEDIARKIWDTQPAGITSYGNVLIEVADSTGTLQPIRFSRAVSIFIWVIVQRDFYSEEEYPADGDDRIKQEIVNWSLEADNIIVGKDIIRQRLKIPVYRVPGINEISIEIAGTLDPGDTPTYQTDPIDISFRQIGVFSADRITVEDLI